MLTFLYNTHRERKSKRDGANNNMRKLCALSRAAAAAPLFCTGLFDVFSVVMWMCVCECTSVFMNLCARVTQIPFEHSRFSLSLSSCKLSVDYSSFVLSAAATTQLLAWSTFVYRLFVSQCLSSNLFRHTHTHTRIGPVPHPRRSSLFILLFNICSTKY